MTTRPMKLSKLIGLLATHLSEHGDRTVVMTVEEGDVHGDRNIGHCWYDFDDTGKGTGKVHISE